MFNKTKKLQKEVLNKGYQITIKEIKELLEADLIEISDLNYQLNNKQTILELLEINYLFIHEVRESMKCDEDIMIQAITQTILQNGHLNNLLNWNSEHLKELMSSDKFLNFILRMDLKYFKRFCYETKIYKEALKDETLLSQLLNNDPITILEFLFEYDIPKKNILKLLAKYITTKETLIKVISADREFLHLLQFVEPSLIDEDIFILALEKDLQDVTEDSFDIFEISYDLNLNGNILSFKIRDYLLSLENYILEEFYLNSNICINLINSPNKFDFLEKFLKKTSVNFIEALKEDYINIENFKYIAKYVSPTDYIHDLSDQYQFDINEYMKDEDILESIKEQFKELSFNEVDDFIYIYTNHSNLLTDLTISRFISNFKNSINSLPLEIFNERFCKLLLKSNPFYLRCVPMKFRTETVCIELLKDLTINDIQNHIKLNKLLVNIPNNIIGNILTICYKNNIFVTKEYKVVLEKLKQIYSI